MTDTNLTNPTNDCANCECYGFPCLNCAEYEYEGSKGPGFDTEGVRVIPTDTPEDIRNRMRDVIYSEI